MTDRVFALTVALSKDVRADDIDDIIAAISMVRGVAGVEAQVRDSALFTAEMRVKAGIAKALIEMLTSWHLEEE